MPLLPAPPSLADGAEVHDVVAWVATHLGDLTLEGAAALAPGAIRGGQTAADTALATLDITGYARDRSTVLPVARRGATRISPYVRHGLLPLPTVWAAVADAPSRDRGRFRDELLWQEYARHLYARVGSALGEPLRRAAPTPAARWADEPWPESMRCMQEVVGQLHDDGWVVNQARMWLASQWAVRAGADWRAGEQEMFAHLLDGSRAANRLGWQWTVGTGSGKPYGFSRWQVEKRAPSLCRSCPLASACPIDGWPDADAGPALEGPSLGRDEIPPGPAQVLGAGAGQRVWLTAESLGVDDPALAADPDRPAVFVFDELLLAALRLSGKRLVFLAETLGELAATRTLEVRRGVVTEELAGAPLAATHA
ncbi:MAG: deoxyribodipyrimidine photolyase, partial [Nocardioides sp.]|nr:deoxyribodipyrimidine photolyase [Nocardioides sp.]